MIGAILGGCDSAPIVPVEDDDEVELPGGSTGETLSEIEGSTSGSGEGTSTGDSDGSDDADDASFLASPDGGGAAAECDVWSQDCPAGEKCMPWVNDGGTSWNATRCSPIDPDPQQAGESCTVEGSAGSGIDDCEIGTMCWEVDPETLEGTCVALCQGDPDAPLCSSPDARCSITNDGVLPLCLPMCDPLLQDCAEGQGCYWLSGDEGFVCAQDVSGELGAPGQPCDGFALNRCDPGSQCLPAEAVPGCDLSGSCCSAFCDIEEPSPGCLHGQDCAPLFDPGRAPPGAEAYGVCAMPPE